MCEIQVYFTIKGKEKHESFIFHSEEKAARWIAAILSINNADVLKVRTGQNSSCGVAIEGDIDGSDPQRSNSTRGDTQDKRAVQVNSGFNELVVSDGKRESAMRWIVSSIRTQQIKKQSSAFYLLLKHSLLVVQTEALTAAESLAGMNEEFLVRLDSVPKRIGLKNVVSLVEKGHFKLKLTALDRLRRKS